MSDSTLLNQAVPSSHQTTRKKRRSSRKTVDDFNKVNSQSLDDFLGAHIKKNDLAKILSPNESLLKPELSAADVLGIKSKPLLRKNRSGKAGQKLAKEKELKSETSKSWFQSIQSVHVPGQTWSPYAGWLPGPQIDLNSNTHTEISSNQTGHNLSSEDGHVLPISKPSQFIMLPSYPPSYPVLPHSVFPPQNHEQDEQHQLQDPKQNYNTSNGSRQKGKFESELYDDPEAMSQGEKVSNIYTTHVQNLQANIKREAFVPSEKNKTIPDSETKESVKNEDERENYVNVTKTSLKKFEQSSPHVAEIDNDDLSEPYTLEATRQELPEQAPNMRDTMGSSVDLESPLVSQTEDPSYNSHEVSIQLPPIASSNQNTEKSLRSTSSDYKPSEKPVHSYISSNISEAESAPYDEASFVRMTTSLLSKVSPPEKNEPNTVNQLHDKMERKKEENNIEADTASNGDQKEAVVAKMENDKDTSNSKKSTASTDGSHTSNESPITKLLSSPKKAANNLETNSTTVPGTKAMLESRIQEIVSAQERKEANKVKTSSEMGHSPLPILKKSPLPSTKKSLHLKETANMKRVHFDAIAYLKGQTSPKDNDSSSYPHKSRLKQKSPRKTLKANAIMEKSSSTDSGDEKANAETVAEAKELEKTENLKSTAPEKTNSPLHEEANSKTSIQVPLSSNKSFEDSEAGALKNVSMENDVHYNEKKYLGSESFEKHSNEDDVKENVKDENEGSRHVDESLLESEEKSVDQTLHSSTPPSGMSTKDNPIQNVSHNSDSSHGIIRNGSVFKRSPESSEKKNSPSNDAVSQISTNENKIPIISLDKTSEEKDFILLDPEIPPLREIEEFSDVTSILESGTLGLLQNILESHTEQMKETNHVERQSESVDDLSSNEEAGKKNEFFNVFPSSPFEVDNSKNDDGGVFSRDDFFANVKLEEENKAIHLEDIFSSSDETGHKGEESEVYFEVDFSRAFHNEEPTSPDIHQLPSTADNVQKDESGEFSTSSSMKVGVPNRMHKEANNCSVQPITPFLCGGSVNDLGKTIQNTVQNCENNYDKKDRDSLTTKERKLKKKKKGEKNSSCDKKTEIQPKRDSFESGETKSSEEWKAFLGKKMTSMSSTAKAMRNKKEKETVETIKQRTDGNKVSDQHQNNIQSNRKMQIDDLIKLAEIESSSSESVVTERATSLIQALTRSFSGHLEEDKQKLDTYELFTRNNEKSAFASEPSNTSNHEDKAIIIDSVAYEESIPKLKSLIEKRAIINEKKNQDQLKGDLITNANSTKLQMKSYANNNPNDSNPPSSNHQLPIIGRLANPILNASRIQDSGSRLCGNKCFVIDEDSSHVSQKQKFSSTYLRKLLESKYSRRKRTSGTCLESNGPSQEFIDSIGGLTLSQETSEVSSYNLASLPGDGVSVFGQSQKSVSLSVLENMKYDDWERVFSGFKINNNKKVAREAAVSQQVDYMVKALSVEPKHNHNNGSNVVSNGETNDENHEDCVKQEMESVLDDIPLAKGSSISGSNKVSSGEKASIIESLSNALSSKNENLQFDNPLQETEHAINTIEINKVTRDREEKLSSLNPISAESASQDQKGETWADRKTKINEILNRFDAAINQQRLKKQEAKMNNPCHQQQGETKSHL